MPAQKRNGLGSCKLKAYGQVSFAGAGTVIIAQGIVLPKKGRT